jgi:hypothetical protein
MLIIAEEYEKIAQRAAERLKELALAKAAPETLLHQPKAARDGAR